MSDLIDLFKNTVSETLVYQSSELLGEPVENISSAVDAIFPTLLGAVAQKGRTDAGAAEILDYMHSNNINGTILQDLPSLLSGGPEVEAIKANGADILRFLMETKVNPMIDSIANTHRLRTSSSSTLLKIVATLLFTAISRVVAERRLNAGGLKDMLNSQAEAIRSRTPEPLANMIYDPPPATPVTVHGSLEGAPRIEEEKEQSILSRLLPWIVLLIAALGLFYFLDKGSDTPGELGPSINQDSIDNVRRMDSLRAITRDDSLMNAMENDSISPATDTINN